MEEKRARENEISYNSGDLLFAPRQPPEKMSSRGQLHGISTELLRVQQQQALSFQDTFALDNRDQRWAWKLPALLHCPGTTQALARQTWTELPTHLPRRGRSQTIEKGRIWCLLQIWVQGLLFIPTILSPSCPNISLIHSFQIFKCMTFSHWCLSPPLLCKLHEGRDYVCLLTILCPLAQHLTHSGY